MWLDDEWDLQLFTHDLCGFMSSTIIKPYPPAGLRECPWVFVMRVLLHPQRSCCSSMLWRSSTHLLPLGATTSFEQRDFSRKTHDSPSIVTWAQGVSESWQSWRPITKSIVTWHSPASFSNCCGFTTTDSWGTGVTVKSLEDASQYTEYTTCTVYLWGKNPELRRMLKHYRIYGLMKYIVLQLWVIKHCDYICTYICIHYLLGFGAFGCSSSCWHCCYTVFDFVIEFLNLFWEAWQWVRSFTLHQSIWCRSFANATWQMARRWWVKNEYGVQSFPRKGSRTESMRASFAVQSWAKDDCVVVSRSVF